MISIAKVRFCFALLMVALLEGGCCHRGPDPTDARAAAGEICRAAMKRTGGGGQGQDSTTNISPQEKNLEDILRYGDDRVRKMVEDLSGGNTSIDILAEVTGGEGKLFLIWKEDGWRLRGGGVLDSRPLTPGMALALLMQALESGDCDKLASLAPPEVVFRLGRNKILEGCRGAQNELAKKAASFRGANASKLNIENDRATLALSDGGVLRLVRVDGYWYVDDL